MAQSGFIDPGPLAGVRVLEVGRHLGVAACGLHLTAMGADVVQLELPGRSVPIAEATYFDRGRTRAQPGSGGAVARLTDLADVLLVDLAEKEAAQLGIPADAADLRSGSDAQVLVSISSLGRDGPNRSFRMTDLTEWASTGLANVTRRPHPDIERYVPVLPPGFQPQGLAGLAATSAVFAARRWVRSTGEPVIAEVCVQEVAAALLHGIYPNFVWNGIVTGHPSTPATSLGMLIPAVDGDVYIRTLDPRQWDALMDWVDDAAVSELGADPDSRLANNDALKLLMGEWSRTRSRLELLEEGQRRHIPIALPRSLDDVVEWQQLRARGVWRSVEFESRSAVAPRLPLIEPQAWAQATEASAADVVPRWQRRGAQA